MHRDARWFRCFAEVPNVGYASDPQRRARLAARNATPTVERFRFERKEHVSLMWPSPSGGTSASPAHDLAHSYDREEASNTARERVLDALELPGQIMDYHFAMQGVGDLLHKRRRAEPWLFSFVEWLAWFDARLLESHRELFRIGDKADDGYLSVFSVGFLVDVHEDEGCVHEALALAERFAWYQPADVVERLRARAAGMLAEHA